MIILASCATLVLLAAYGIGRAVCGDAVPARLGDRLVLRCWAGLLVLAGSLLAISLVAPLGGFWVAVIALIAGLTLWRERAPIRRALATFPGRAVAIGAPVLLLAITIFTSRDVAHYDTGFYHLPYMTALAEHGTVRGMALIHHRFGYSSSWFALATPFVDLFDGARLTTIGGTLAFFLLLAPTCLAGARIVNRRGGPADWFLVVAVPVGLCHRAILVLMPSSTPDTAVIVAIVVFLWALLIDRGGRLAPVILILAIAAAALKASVFPLIAGAAIYALVHWRAALAHGTAVVLCAALTLGAAMAANFSVSGCFLYPAVESCLDVPWGVPGDLVAAVSTFITNSPIRFGPNVETWHTITAFRDGSRAPADLDLRLAVVEGRYGMTVIATALAALAANALIAARRRDFAFGIAVLTVALGLGYGILVPSVRFALPWYGALIGLLAAGLALLCAGWFAGRLPRLAVPAPIGGLAAVAVMAVLLAVIETLPTRGDRQLELGHFPGKPTAIAARLWLPPTVALRQYARFHVRNPHLVNPVAVEAEWITHRIYDVEFRRPADGELCWWAPFPCAPEGEPLDPLRLRDPAAGIGAGFVRAEPSQTGAE
ncbi:MAG: hypothetical protein GY791_04185 [Alphaproteobacteria bacterium]|nr:hypothetical protein [Alphaproteobacteria bacterium]